jgi:hypothetical protein
MKTLANPKDRDEILQRLSAIAPSSQRRWGKMSAVQMICHLCDALRVSIGEIEAKPADTFLSRTMLRWAALWVPAQWPHGVRTVPECEQGLGGTPPGQFESDLIELRRLLDRFTEQPRSFEWQAHPIFGPLSDRGWLRWGYLHMDHHLRQFGA